MLLLPQSSDFYFSIPRKMILYKSTPVGEGLVRSSLTKRCRCAVGAGTPRRVGTVGRCGVLCLPSCLLAKEL